MTDWLVRLWRRAWIGGALRAAVGLGALYAVLEVVLRNNPPPPGEYAYGVIIGLLYALLAFGLILVHRASRIINFAQAQMGAVSAVLAVLLIKVHHVPYLAAFAVAMTSGMLSGLLVDVVVVRRLYRASRLVLSVATIGVGLVFAALQLLLPGWLGAKNSLDPAPPKTPFSGLHFSIYPARFDANSLVVIVAVAAVVVGLGMFFKLTNVGIAVRGAAENADRAALLGIPIKRVSTVVWMLAAALSSLSIFLRIPVIGLPIGVFIDPSILAYGLAAAVIARMESFSVALVAGIALGVLEQSLFYFSRDSAVPAALVLPILLVAMLVQRQRLSRSQDTGIATWSLAKVFHATPPEVFRLPEVRVGRWALGIGLGAVVLFGYPLLGLKQQTLASVVVIYGIVAVSLVILTGWAGQISLGQWGIAGMGAATAGYLAGRHNADFFVVLVAAGLVGAVVAVIVGLPALRITGLYLAVTTLAFAIAVQVYVLSPRYFGGVLPTHGHPIERPTLYGHYRLDGEKAFFYVCLIALGLCILSTRALRRARTGRVIIAIRDKQRGAQAFAVRAASMRLRAFAISGFWAAIAGALFAYHESAVDTAAFSPDVSLTLLVVVVIGGVTSLPGALLGTAYVGVLKYGDLSAAAQFLATGFGALLLLLLVPGGLAQLMYGARDGLLRLVARRRGIVVASLIADVRIEKPPTIMALAEPTPSSAELVEPSGSGAATRVRRRSK